MSRKEPSFGQLVAYMQDIDKSDTQYNIYQNIYGKKLEDINTEFQENARLIHKRKNGVYLYHEILSISKNQQLDDKLQKQILRDIAYEYAQRRAPHNLIFATLHDDHEHHLHYHFCISANALGERKKTRLTKVQFDQFKKSMEMRAIEKYPELEQKIVINKSLADNTFMADDEKLSNKGAEIKRRTGKTPQRDKVKQKLTEIFANTGNKQSFFEAMSEAGFEIYIRGKTIGILDTAHNRKHRLKTLGVLDEFNAMSARIKLDEASKQQQEKAKNYGKETVDRKQNEDTTQEKSKKTHRQKDNVQYSKNKESSKEKETNKATYTSSQTSSHEKKQKPSEKMGGKDSTAERENTEQTDFDLAQAKRQAEIEKIRQAKKQASEQSSQQSQKDKQ